MNQPTPCPQCRSDRVWARAAIGDYGITHVAFCPGCARAATLCGRCGGELVLTRQSSIGVPGRARVETVLQCPSCRTTAMALPSPSAAAPATPQPGVGAGNAPAAPTWPAVRQRARAVERPAQPSSFLGTAAPGVVQRVADDVESLAVTRYVRRRHLVDLVGEAARRAEAMARLEIELSRLPHPHRER